MNQFRNLMFVVLSSGALAGFMLFAVQHFTVIPLIESAETYELGAQEATSGTAHHDEGWKPANGWQRTSFTALTTMLAGIGFAALLFGSMAITGRPINTRLGALWGVAAFVCLSVAPTLGLPPKPPGVETAGLYERQLWWSGTALATAMGLWLLAGEGRSWLLRIGGVACLSLPHWIGAPVVIGQNAVPAQLINRFTIASVSTTGLFWLVLGTIGGFIYSHHEADSGLQGHKRGACTANPKHLR